MPTSFAEGRASFANSNNLKMMLGPAKLVTPVILPPGSAKLFTKPISTGSATAIIMMGVVPVACCRARTAGGAAATITSILSETSSDASSKYRSGELQPSGPQLRCYALPSSRVRAGHLRRMATVSRRSGRLESQFAEASPAPTNVVAKAGFRRCDRSRGRLMIELSPGALLCHSASCSD